MVDRDHVVGDWLPNRTKGYLQWTRSVQGRGPDQEEATDGNSEHRRCDKNPRLCPTCATGDSEWEGMREKGEPQ